MNRRHFLKQTAAAGLAASAVPSLIAQKTAAHAPDHTYPANGVALPDAGWKLWIDRKALWQDDAIYLPADVDLANLPVNPPTTGWDALYAMHDGEEFTTVTLPTTVEQHFWGKFGERSYTPEEYRYAADDPIPQNGAYVGVSWWWKEIDIPASMQGQRIMLHLRGARMRAEVYLNEQLVGYSIMEELPFDCDMTAAAKPGGKNILAIRITNPGGRYDWVDGLTIRWGKVNLYRSHGFGGLDRELMLKAVPKSGRIADAWVLNTPEPRTINAFTVIEGDGKETLYEVLDPATGKVLGSTTDGPKASLHCPGARLWELDKPVLYNLRITLTTQDGKKDVRVIPFGFRWFAPEGLGTNAIFRLNGKRIKVYSAISWGFWGINGLWPTPELAEREVTQAKQLGLNCLNFHRNLGKEDVLRAHDRLGLLRYMEPGAGKQSIGRLPNDKGSSVAASGASIVMARPDNAADLFARNFMLEKCKAMVRAFRSHPSLIQYTLQNELGADLKNPDTFTAIQAMHDEDPSRSVVLNDGFVARGAAQAWFSPYNNTMHRSDKEQWGGWWNNHQGAGDQWYDRFYTSADAFTYLQPLKTALVEFGEMEGCAVADNHSLMIHQIGGNQFGNDGKTYDLKDHREIVAGYEKFLDRWGFRKAFPTAEQVFKATGKKCYESWQQYMENVRICDAVDYAVISGWESTAIENHSGIVDNLRNHKGDPALIASSLQPVRPVAKQHRLCHAVGEAATFDIYLLNDSTKPVSGKLHFSMVEPGGKLVKLGSWDVPAFVADQFSYTVQTNFQSPVLAKEGIYKFRLACDTVPAANFSRDIWVANTQLKFAKPITIGVSSVIAPVRKQLAALQGAEIKEFAAGEHYDLIVASGVVKGSKLDRQVGDETGLEAQPAKGAPPPPPEPAGEISEAVLAAVKAGTPLLAMVPDDMLADGVAKQLAALGAFTYDGQVGDLRAPWMGNWLFVREHPTFTALPVNQAMGIHYQANGKASNGLLVEKAPGAEDLDVIVGYSRDHDRKVGAASFLCKVGGTRVLVHRAPEFSAPLQQRWLANSIAHLTGAKLG